MQENVVQLLGHFFVTRESQIFSIKTTATRFELARAEPIGFRDQLLNHSDTLSVRSASISGLVVEYIVAIDVTRVRFPVDAFYPCFIGFVGRCDHHITGRQ